MPKRTECAVPGCYRRPIERSYWCPRHAQRSSRYGSPTGKPLPDKELRPYHQFVRDGIAKYWNRKATQTALSLAQEILDYTPTHGFGVEIEIQNEMRRLVNGGVTADELLVRVCEFFAFLEANPGRFKSKREEDFALARAVLRLRPTARRYGYCARLLNWFAPLVRDRLGLYALALLRRLKQDAAERAALIKQTTNFDEEAKQV